MALLDELYVAPGSRGQGVGSALLARIETIAQQRGAELLEINVDGDDTDARRFYERHGYANCEPGEEQPLLCRFRELKGAKLRQCKAISQQVPLLTRARSDRRSDAPRGGGWRKCAPNGHIGQRRYVESR